MNNKILLSLLFAVIAFTFQVKSSYGYDRVYTGNQVSNTVSVIDPSTNTFLGEIVLGKPSPDILSPLYKGASLVHGLRYDKNQKILAVVSIGSNSITFISTQDNKILKTVYVGRAPHEPTFTPDGNEVWVTIRGEGYISVIDMKTMEEIKKIPVADGPGMISFSKDGKLAYIASSFTPELDIVDTKTYKVVKKIPVTSPFSPNIYTSPDGKLVALTHKDVGKVTLIDTSSNEIVKLLETGNLTNHVSFVEHKGQLLMAVTVGGENNVKIYDVSKNYKHIATIPVGTLPHGLWPSTDGNTLYIGLEYADMVQPIDLNTMKALKPIPIGQSPQALVYANDAVIGQNTADNLSPLADLQATQVIVLSSNDDKDASKGQLSVRNIGQIELVEQQFFKLKPNNIYTLALSKNKDKPQADYSINSFKTDAKGKYTGQSTGVLKKQFSDTYKKIVLIDDSTKNAVLSSK